MLHFISKTIPVIGILFVFSYGYECPVNAKLDEELCTKLKDAVGDDIIKFNIILKQPRIEQSDADKSKSSEEFSKYRLDSLARYLNENKQKIQSLFTENTLYAVDTSEVPVKLTADNIVIDFHIPAAGIKETILAIAESDLIVRFENYIEAIPTITTGCDLNAKFDEELCSQLTSVEGNALIKCNIIFKQPVIERSEGEKTMNDEEFSKFRLDSLKRYLDSKKEEIVTLLTNNILYTLDESETQERVSEKNTTIDFSISVQASRTTIIDLADSSDLIARIEHYTESGPAGIVPYKSRFIPSDMKYKVTTYSLNGRVISRRTVIPQQDNSFMSSRRSPTLYIYSIQNGTRSSTHKSLFFRRR